MLQGRTRASSSNGRKDPDMLSPLLCGDLPVSASGWILIALTGGCAPLTEVTPPGDVTACKDPPMIVFRGRGARKNGNVRHKYHNLIHSQVQVIKKSVKMHNE